MTAENSNKTELPNNNDSTKEEIINENRDIDKWKEIKIGKCFALMRNHKIILGKEETERQKLVKKMGESIKIRRNNKDINSIESHKTRNSINIPLPIEGKMLENEKGIDQKIESNYLNMLNSIRKNQSKFFDYTEKSLSFIQNDFQKKMIGKEQKIQEKNLEIKELSLEKNNLENRVRDLDSLLVKYKNYIENFIKKTTNK